MTVNSNAEHCIQWPCYTCRGNVMHDCDVAISWPNYFTKSQLINATTNTAEMCIEWPIYTFLHNVIHDFNEVITWPSYHFINDNFDSETEYEIPWPAYFIDDNGNRFNDEHFTIHWPPYRIVSQIVESVNNDTLIMWPIYRQIDDVTDSVQGSCVIQWPSYFKNERRSDLDGNSHDIKLFDSGELSSGWQELVNYTDSALHNVLLVCFKAGYQQPEVNYYIEDAFGDLAARLEIAWPTHKFGIALSGSDISGAIENGWNVVKADYFVQNHASIASLRNS